MAGIFISYAREDEEAALKIYGDLKSRGFKPWLDKIDLLPGEHWRSAITCAIKNSSFFLALLSTSSINKKGFVQKEWVFARICGWNKVSNVPSGPQKRS